MARVALTAEYLVCKVANISEKDMPKYIGRSQYPKFKNKPLIHKHTPKEACQHTIYWGAVKNTLRALVNFLPLTESMTLTTESLRSALQELFGFMDDHLEGLPEDVIAGVKSIGPMLQYADRSVGLQLHTHAADCFKHYLNKTSNARFLDWQKFVKQQLAAGGGKLFAYISMQDKAFLNVDWRQPGSL